MLGDVLLKGVLRQLLPSQGERVQDGLRHEDVHLALEAAAGVHLDQHGAERLTVVGTQEVLTCRLCILLFPVDLGNLLKQKRKYFDNVDALIFPIVVKMDSMGEAFKIVDISVVKTNVFEDSYKLTINI